MMPEDAAAFVEVQERSYARASPSILTSYPHSRAMDGPRMAAFLDSRRHAVCATSRRDGRPQASPVAFIIWNGAFWFASVRGARLRNLRARPYASVVIVLPSWAAALIEIRPDRLFSYDATIEAPREEA